MDLSSPEFEQLIAEVANSFGPLADKRGTIVYFFPGRGDALPAPVRRLLDLIASNEALAPFHAGFFEIGKEGWAIQDQHLVYWLTQRSMQTSPSQAAADLRRYLDARTIPVRRRTLLAGVLSESEFAFGTGAKFLPRAALALDDDPILKQEWESTFNFRLGMAHPSGVIETAMDIPKRHHLQSAMPERVGSDPENLSRSHANEVMALQLIAPGSSPLITWTSLPTWCPVAAPGRALHQRPQTTSTAHTLTPDEIEALSTIISQLDALRTSVKNAITLALHRNCVAVTQQTYVDRAVDLRIAYEVAFGVGDSDDPEKKGELRFRLALRAARFLGTTPEERRTIFKTARDLYDMCSGAVHSGQISSDWKGSDQTKLLGDGSDVVRRALLKIVMEGAPDWSTIMLN